MSAPDRRSRLHVSQLLVASPEEHAALIILVLSVLHALLSVLAVMAYPTTVIATTWSWSWSMDPVEDRHLWIFKWLQVSLTGTAVCLAPIISAMELFTGYAWLRGQEVEVQTQTRALSRMASLVLPVSIIAAAACLGAGSREWAPSHVFMFGIWFGIQALYSRFILTRARKHVPEAPAESITNTLVFVLMLGSLFQFWMAPVVSGYSSGELTTNGQAASWFILLKNLVCGIFGGAVVATSAFGVVITTRILLSNAEWPAAVKWLKLLSGMHLVALAVTQPIALACDAFILTHTHQRSLLHGPTFRTWLMQPSFNVLLLSALICVSWGLQKRLRGSTGQEATYKPGMLGVSIHR